MVQKWCKQDWTVYEDEDERTIDVHYGEARDCCHMDHWLAELLADEDHRKIVYEMWDRSAILCCCCCCLCYFILVIRISHEDIAINYIDEHIRFRPLIHSVLLDP